jgi:hypothetical protein
MTKFKSFNDIVLEMLDNLKLTQPNLDIKPNSVARDLFIDTQAIQVANLYDNIRAISSLQSIMNVYGQDLTNYGANYGISRQSGSKAFGTVVVTFGGVNSWAQSTITLPYPYYTTDYRVIATAVFKTVGASRLIVNVKIVNNSSFTVTGLTTDSTVPAGATVHSIEWITIGQTGDH